MSKMGAEFEKNLDNAKYDLYEASMKLWMQLDNRRIDYCLCGHLAETCWYCTMLQPIEKALDKAKRLTNKKGELYNE